MTASESYTEKQLLLDIADDNHEAFAKLFDEYYHKIYYHVLAYAKSAVVAEEVVQDVFVKIWEKRYKLREVESFKDYLFIMSRNEVVSAMRKKINKPIIQLELELVENMQANNKYDIKEAEAFILKGIDNLPPQQKAVFTLKRIDNLSYEEISEQLGISKNTVKYHLVTALNYLRGYVAQRPELMLITILTLTD